MRGISVAIDTAAEVVRILSTAQLVSSLESREFQLWVSYLIPKGNECESMDIDIDGVLMSMGSLRPKRSDLREGILPFPDIRAQEDITNLRSALHNSAVFPEFEQPTDEMNIFLAQCSRTELLPQEDDQHLEVPPSKSSVEYLHWLETEGLTTLETMHERPLRRLDAGNLIQTSGVLLNLADELDYLRPHNDSHLGHPKMINIALWRIYWHALIAEMRTVIERCSPEVRNSGVFVLTTWPYKEFLRLMVGQLLTQAISVIYENDN